jgi:hypothetical protein
MVCLSNALSLFGHEQSVKGITVLRHRFGPSRLRLPPQFESIQAREAANPGSASVCVDVRS